MELSVLIPTRGRADALARCVGALAAPDPDPGPYEVVVGLDGEDDAARDAAIAAWNEAGGRPGGLRVETCPRRGYIDVRHRLIPTLSGRIVVSLNDDVVPVPGFLAAHRRAHDELESAGRAAVIVGDSRFAPVPDPTLLDVALDRTGLVFFWHSMTGDDRDHDYGFRHCFGLNVSASREMILDAGGMPSVVDTYGYDDVELGWRLTGFGLPVLYRPEAEAPHEHRYRAEDLLRREFRLGVAAVRYARVNPEFTRTLFRRDLLGADEIAFAREQLSREAGDLRRRRDRFLALDHVPATDFGPGALDLACDLVADMARPLRRACWFEGLLHERGLRAPENVRHDPITPGLDHQGDENSVSVTTVHGAGITGARAGSAAIDRAAADLAALVAGRETPRRAS